MGSIMQEPDFSKERHAVLEEALRKVQGQYFQDHPLSPASHEEACRYLPGGNTRTVLYTDPFPLAWESGHGNKPVTVDGHEYTDFLREYTAVIYGHNHPIIRKTIENALDRGWNLGGHNQKERKLAHIICERFPPIHKVRFVKSGTEANMMAIATAIAYSKRSKVLIFQKGYHGSTISGRIPDGKPSINLPHDFVTAPYDDVEETEKLVKDLPPWLTASHPC